MSHVCFKRSNIIRSSFHDNILTSRHGEKKLLAIISNGNDLHSSNFLEMKKKDVKNIVQR